MSSESVASAACNCLPCAADGVDALACAEPPLPAFSAALNCAAEREALASTAGGTLPTAACESSDCAAIGSVAAAADKSLT